MKKTAAFSLCTCVLHVSVAKQILCDNSVDFIRYLLQAYRDFPSLLPVITSEVGI